MESHTMENNNLHRMLNPLLGPIISWPNPGDVHVEGHPIPNLQGRAIEMSQPGKANVPVEVLQSALSILHSMGIETRVPINQMEAESVQLVLCAEGEKRAEIENADSKIRDKFMSSWIVDHVATCHNLSRAARKVMYDLAKANDQVNLIFRGESDLYHSVRSTLSRRWNTDSPAALASMESNNMNVARRFCPEIEYSDIEMRGMIQHMGGYTNMLDFSTEIWVALFFACMDPSKTGRIWAYDFSKELNGYTIHELAHRIGSPQPRWNAQYGVGVIAETGIIDPSLLIEIAQIPPEIKDELTTIISSTIEIRAESMFPDLEGFIRYGQDTAPHDATIGIAMRHIETGNLMAADAYGDRYMNNVNSIIDQACGFYVKSLIAFCKGDLRLSRRYMDNSLELLRIKPDYVQHNSDLIDIVLKASRTKGPKKRRRVASKAVKRLRLDFNEDLYTVKFEGFTFIRR